MFIVGRKSSDELVKNSPDAVEVGRKVIRLTLHNFWRHVVWTTAVAVGYVILSESAFAQPEIGDAQVPMNIN